MARSQNFRFDGGAGTYIGTGILAVVITLVTFGIATPFAIVLRQRWRAKHTYVNGHRLVFVGTGVGLFGLWIKWLLLTIVTLGIYAFWLVPQVTKWVVENTDFDPSFTPGAAFAATRDLAPAGGASELPSGEGSAVPGSGPGEAQRSGEGQPPQLV
jgi:uncharacterized membrane protein YjgN (DUF898 family)